MDSTARTVRPRPSATVLLIRPGREEAIEVLLLQRADRGDQYSRRWVFPGGVLDPTEDALHAFFGDIDDPAASARVNVAEGGLSYWAAAIRETFEEAGLLIAAAGPDSTALQIDEADLQTWRADLHRLTHGTGASAMAALCERRRWRLSGQALHPVAHWITPVGMPKRFDTRFFLALAPAGQDVRIDGHEMVDHRWCGVAELLGRHPPVEIQGPTHAMVSELARHADVEAAIAWARSLRDIPTVQPRLARNAAGQVQSVQPSHPSYAEVGRIDPMGVGKAHSVIRPGEPVQLIEGRLLRLTANNGSMMTGPGTNTYLLRAAGDDWVVIDPGPSDDAHVGAICALLRELNARLTSILVTHTHIDHSPASGSVKGATGATCYGRLAAHLDLQDAGFVPDVHLLGEERLAFGGNCVLRAIHTPGHASNHICYLWEAERILFTGDHVMQGSTVIINPPDGDMDAYLGSLGRLSEMAGREFDSIAPGHGFLIEDTERVLAGLTRHRLWREAKVQAALTALGSATAEELAVRVYDDVDAKRHRAAMRSLTAHLLRLERLGQAQQVAGRWLPVSDRS